MIHRTRPEATAAHGWADLPGLGVEVTILPVVDSDHELAGTGEYLFARPTGRSALAIADRFGARLITPDELEALRRIALVIEPWTTTKRQKELATSEHHDAVMWARLKGAGWDGQRPVLLAKTFTAGAPKGRAYLMGMWVEHLEHYSPDRRGPGWVQPPSEDDGPHNDDHHDYATLLVLVRPLRGGTGPGSDRPAEPTEPTPPSDPPAQQPPACPAEPPELVGKGEVKPPTIRRGSTGPWVERWQKIVQATADGIFGPGTERLTKAWQAARQLVADGIVGPKSWAAALAGTEPSIVTGIDVSHHQVPSRIDWSRIAVDHRFAIVRATYGVGDDSACKEHVRGARAAGLQVGGYAFFRQGQPWQAQLAALELALEAAELGAGAVVPAIDLEANVKFDGPVDSKAHNAGGRALVEAVAERWGGTLVYMSPGHWLELGRPAWLLQPGVHIWTAHWAVDEPAWPADWSIWQVSDRHQHAGYSTGPLDLNRARRLPLAK